MKYFILLSALAVAAQAWGRWNEGLSVRFGIGLGIGTDFFIPVPQTLSAAKNQRWVESPRPSGQPRSSLVLYNPSIDDVVLGAFYDSDDNVAGLQIALPQDSYTDAFYDWVSQGFVEWTAPANSTGSIRTYWVTAVYFVSETTAAKTPEERAHLQGRVLQESQIYVTGFHGELMRISTTASEVANTSVTSFTRQACIPFMGRHYYYNMSSTTECTNRGILPWFTMVDLASDSNQLIGIGFMNTGKLPASALVRDYFERPVETEVRITINSAPECMYDLTRNYGRLTMHIYFVDAPILINCIF